MASDSSKSPGSSSDDSSQQTPVQDELVGVIMAGGVGSRFWPASTQDRPKQFLSFFGENSLMQQSYDRLAAMLPPERILVLTSCDYVGLARLQLPDLPPENVIGEPLRRDTAAAVTLAASIAANRFDDPVMAIVTADHIIEPIEDFSATLLSAARAAASGDVLYTFGIQPDHAATGFGYLELGDEVLVDDEVVHSELVRFVEKPDQGTAQRYIDSGKFLWNSGMFVWRTSAILEEVERQLPEHAQRIEHAVRRDGHPDFDAALVEAFEPLDKVSVDFGVMENARNVRCAAATFIWHDVGSFTALADHLPIDDSGNAHRARLYGLDAHNNIVFSEDGDEVIAIVGADDLVIVRAGKRTLVAPRERAEDIKKLVAMLDEDVK
jgi:mannose-1-phosphate guanylyltransferase